jgi:hypothetical protein
MAQFSQQAKERALEFRIDRVMPKYEALYNKALRRD